MPSAAHQIEFLRPRGFLSFAPDFPGVSLGPLNVLVGPNGSGKSNFIDAARFLAAAPNGLRPFLTQGGSTIADWCFCDVQTASVDIRVTGPSRTTPLHYRLEIANEGDARIVDETLEEVYAKEGKKRPFFFLSHEPGGIRLSRKSGGERRLVPIDVDPSVPVIEQIKDFHEYPEMAWMRRHLDSYGFFGEAHFGRIGNELRQAQPVAQPHQTLLENGRNLPLVLNALYRRSGLRQQLLDHVREIYPFVDQIEVDMAMGQVQVIFVESGRNRHTPAARLSDGTMRWLMLGVLLLDDRADTPLFLDEPELALHPDAIISLGRLLRTASLRRQVIVTTHSDALLSEFGTSPDVVCVFDRGAAGTRVTRLDAAELRSWFEDHTLGEIWKSGRIGGNRW